MRNYSLRKRVLVTGSRSELVFRPLPQDDPMQRKPDISLAERQLGWKPTISLDEGLEKVIAYFRESLSVMRPAASPKPIAR